MTGDSRKVSTKKKYNNKKKIMVAHSLASHILALSFTYLNRVTLLQMADFKAFYKESIIMSSIRLFWFNNKLFNFSKLINNF